MINVAFIPPQNSTWMGGVNYYQKIFDVMDSNADEFKAYVFVGKKIESDIFDIYSGYKNITVVQHALFDRLSIAWFSEKLLELFFRRSFLLKKILKSHGVNILSHATVPKFKCSNIKYIPWVPDLQHLFLPQFFSQKEIKGREKAFKSIFNHCDKVLVSSLSAKNDLLSHYAIEPANVDVLHFTSSPNVSDVLDIDELKEKYNIPDKYIYIPNQFWAHKNHKLAFDAIRLLKNRGANTHLICTGSTEDTRDKNYFTGLISGISDITGNISILGKIPYRDVVSLVIHSECVLNPSLFEGWSTSVEECKALGKKMILSDIAVHKEQYPDACFFVKDQVESLADAIEKFSLDSSSRPSKYDHKDAVNKFSSNYRKILLDLAEVQKEHI
ncbi:glycosyltransferase family 4 protein [Pectobacterium versatile]|uniref:glycosyltransferase family 4 protein n=1 Tax=Pectobacterium versatile TaxID=2488639 RepID=UPI001968B7A5|nr:glycosyltransferase family 1 protein [Pectobacterium versatile]MBN3238214.1 glycosyltransferase family 4 protein [Pectobacterium versatile]